MSQSPPDLPESVRRAPYLFFRIRDIAVYEIRALLRGEKHLEYAPQLEIIGPLTGTARACTPAEISFLAEVPADRAVSVEQLLRDTAAESSELAGMLREGVLTHDHDPRWRGRSSIPWNPIAALFHTTCLFEGFEAAGVDERRPEHVLEEQRRNVAAHFAELTRSSGPPPPARLRYRTQSQAVELPVEEELPDAFFAALSRRRTCRLFADQPLALGVTSTLLRSCFGVRGTVRLSKDYWVPLKSSPSGGATHPIEAFPLVRRVEGIEPGIYHYDAFRHTLEPLCAAPAEVMSSLLVRMSHGQDYVGSAAMVVLLVARLGRNFWKYRESCRTYSVILQDAGHLSQTFYLISAHLGLGAFYTAAVSGSVTRDVLGIDDGVDAPIGLCGCGIPSESADEVLNVLPYVPRTTPAPQPAEVRQVVPSGGGSGSQSNETATGDGYFRNLRITPPIDEE